MTDLTELTAQVLALGKDDRDSLLARLDYENIRAMPLPNRQEMAVWEALGRYARHRSLTDFWRDKTAGMPRTAYGNAVATLHEFAEQAQPVRHSSQDQAALWELAFDCLAGDLTARGIEATPKTLLGGLARLRLAIDRCYPGYLDAGLLHKLIRVAVPA